MDIRKRLGGKAFSRFHSFSNCRLGLSSPLILVIFFGLFAAGCSQSKRAEVPVPPTRTAAAISAENNKDLIAAARSNIGVRYKYGGTSPTTGFDCSGFICWTFEQVGVDLPRSVRDQARIGQEIPRSDLQPGDIIVFKGTNHRSGWHAGIYTGDGKFIHSPRTGKTVTETSLDTAYYNKHFYGARRIPRGDSAVLVASAGNNNSIANTNTLVTATGHSSDDILHKPDALQEKKKTATRSKTKKRTAASKSKKTAKPKASKTAQASKAKRG